MKNTEKSLDDIIFEKRNKKYGAYALRRIYSRNLIRAMVISFTLFMMGVSIPLIASYMNESRNLNLDNTTTVTVLDYPKNTIIEKLPELPKATEKKVVPYKPPIVTSNPDDETDELGDLAENVNNNVIIDTNAGKIGISDDEPKTKVLDDDNEILPLAGISEMPEFPGGDAARIKFFAENLSYPQLAKETGVQGSVFLTFVVEKDGSISNINLLRGIGAGCEDEASRVVSIMPKWIPGRQNGKEVRVQFNMPISFVLK
jgi:periplasmic protein TonB